MTDSYSVNALLIVDKMLNVTFTINGTDYIKNVSITPSMTFNQLSKLLEQELSDIQAMVELFNAAQGTFSKDTKGSISVATPIK